MTHVLDTSAILAHYLAEPGAAEVLTLFEFELPLSQFGANIAERTSELERYRLLIIEVANVDEAVRTEAVRLRLCAPERVSAMDVHIAATASLNRATLVHRDLHFSAIPAVHLKQQLLPLK